MSGNEIAAIIAALAALLGAYVAYRKYGPEARKISVETIDINVKVAGESVRIASDLRDDAVGQWARIRDEMVALRGEFDQYRSDTEIRLTEMATELRASRANEAEAKRQVGIERLENTQLRDRVLVLEAEVANLKANGSPDLHSP